MIKKIFNHIKALTRPILITSNLIVFITFTITALIMYKIGSRDLGLILFIAALLYILFNNMESMNRRLKELEEK